MKREISFPCWESNIESMLMICFCCFCVVHQEFTSPGRMVNQQYYGKVVQSLRRQVCQKSLELWWKQDWLIHHYSAAALVTLSVQKCLAPKYMAVVPHPLHSSDLSPLVSSCFWEWSCSYEGIDSRMSLKLRDSHWPSYMQFQKHQFQWCFQQWQQYWSHCFNMEGDYSDWTTWNLKKVSIHFIIN